MAVRQAVSGFGVGSTLLDFLIAWTRATGVITKLNLRVRSDNERAIRLYQRKGFVLEGTISREHLIDGRYFSQDCIAESCSSHGLGLDSAPRRAKRHQLGAGARRGRLWYDDQYATRRSPVRGRPAKARKAASASPR